MGPDGYKKWYPTVLGIQKESGSFRLNPAGSRKELYLVSYTMLVEKVAYYSVSYTVLVERQYSSHSHTVLVERVAYCSSLYIVPFHHILCIMCFPFSCLCNVSYCSLFLTVLMELSGKILSSSFN